MNSKASSSTPRILIFGAYDTRKPRVRLLIEAIRRAGAVEGEILIRAWRGVPQTNIPSKLSFIKVFACMALAYPTGLLRLIRQGRALARKHPGSAVLLPYPGVLEIVLIAPIARLLGLKVILDAFLPIYDTVVSDRALVGGGVIARVIWLFERRALRCADVIVTDTDSHGAYFSSEFGLPLERFQTVLVGAENLFGMNAAKVDVTDILGAEDPRPIVLFYGQLIPLHGVSTIIEAARVSDNTARWVVIGRGQLEPQVERWIADGGETLERRLSWIKWVDYEKLPSVIARASICLGVFGASDKAARVIPNKLFQQAAMGKLVITRSSPAVDELARDYPTAVKTVPKDDPKALAKAVAVTLKEGMSPSKPIADLTPDKGVEQLLQRLSAGV